MTVRFSMLFVFTVIIIVMIKMRHKGDGLTIVEFFVCGIWGFLLAKSSFAPIADQFLRSLASVFGGR